MRWTYLITRLLIVALVWGFFAFGMDPLLRYSAVTALQSATGAKADVAEVTTSFFPPTVTVKNVALASASRIGKNMVEFDELHVSLEPSSLSRRRFVVEEGRLTGVRFDTRRSDDGQLEKSSEPVSEESSWLSDKAMELGDEWLQNLIDQAKAQLDPNTLETYRVGTGVYEKWDAHFEEIVARAEEMKPRVTQLKIQFDNARKGDTLQQIEQYLQVAQQADAVVKDVQQFRDDLKEIVPEVRTDFQTLNEARQRDQQKVKQTLSLLKPDARRISQALLGKTMYRQLQQALSWVHMAREYKDGLRQQVRPPRSAGRDIEFLVRNPAPAFLLKKLAMTGLISINEESVPFNALLADVTEDPKLLGRPCVMQLKSDSTRPLQLKVTYDATDEVPVAEMLADYRDSGSIPLRAGKAQKACVHATLSELVWTTRLTVTGEQIDGNIELQSEIGNLLFEADNDVQPEIIDAANEAIASVRKLNANVVLSGTLTQPDIDLQSDVGEQISEGVQLAFTNQLDRAKERLISEVNSYANDQIEKLKGRFSAEYEKLMNENKVLLDQANEVRTIIASLQSGQADPATLIKQVANSRLIPEKEQKKINGILTEVEGAMQGKLPGRLQEKIPQLPPGFNPQLPPGFNPLMPKRKSGQR